MRLHKENKELKKKQPSSKALFPKRKLKKRWKRLGRPEGHPGTTRRKPDKIDKIEHHRLDICPDCGCVYLSELMSEETLHIQEDIIPADVEEKVILEAIRTSPYLHIDETGWKIAGTNHWLWNFVNERLALYRIRRSRDRKIPEEILTTDYGGIVISDFLSAYDKSGKKRQRCLVHLERDMDKYRFKICQTKARKHMKY